MHLQVIDFMTSRASGCGSWARAQVSIVCDWDRLLSTRSMDDFCLRLEEEFRGSRQSPGAAKGFASRYVQSVRGEKYASAERFNSFTLCALRNSQTLTIRGGARGAR